MTALMVEALVTVSDAAAVVPNWTALAPVRSVPVMVTVVPPAVEPLVGVNVVTVDSVVTKAKFPLEVTVSPEGPATDILTVAAAWALVLAVIVDALVTVNPAAVVAPNRTSLTLSRSVPVMVTVVSPVVGPLAGVIEVMLRRREGNWYADAAAEPAAMAALTKGESRCVVAVNPAVAEAEATTSVLSAVPTTAVMMTAMPHIPVMNARQK